MAANFELFNDGGGKFRWHLRAPNGEIIAASQAYRSRGAAQNGIEAVKKHAPMALVTDLTRRPQKKSPV